MQPGKFQGTLDPVKTALCAVGGGLLGAGLVWGVLKLKDRGVFRLAGADAGALPGLPAKGTAAGAAAVHIRQIRRYAFAASQDQSPVVGITHASYALVLLDTLEELVGRDMIKKAGYDPEKIRKFITELQDAHAERLQSCDTHLQEVLAIERAETSPTPGFVVAGWGAAPRGA